MMTVQHLTFNELSERLRGYERKYRYSTVEFYRQFRSGELDDDDDLMMWAGLSHLYLTHCRVVPAGGLRRDRKGRLVSSSVGSALVQTVRGLPCE